MVAELAGAKSEIERHNKDRAEHLRNIKGLGDEVARLKAALEREKSENKRHRREKKALADAAEKTRAECAEKMDKAEKEYTMALADQGGLREEVEELREEVDSLTETNEQLQELVQDMIMEKEEAQNKRKKACQDILDRAQKRQKKV